MPGPAGDHDTNIFFEINVYGCCRYFFLPCAHCCLHGLFALLREIISGSLEDGATKWCDNVRSNLPPKNIDQVYFARKKKKSLSKIGKIQLKLGELFGKPVSFETGRRQCGGGTFKVGPGEGNGKYN